MKVLLQEEKDSAEVAEEAVEEAGERVVWLRCSEVFRKFVFSFEKESNSKCEILAAEEEKAE